MDYYTRLTRFYSQFRMVANNYNQLVKAVKTIYGDKKALGYLYKTAEATVRMNELIEEVIDLTREYRAWLQR